MTNHAVGRNSERKTTMDVKLSKAQLEWASQFDSIKIRHREEWTVQATMVPKFCKGELLLIRRTRGDFFTLHAEGKGATFDEAWAAMEKEYESEEI